MTRVPATAVGSGAKVMDLFPLPLWLFIPLRMVAWGIRHWYIALTILALLLLDWRYALVIFLLIPILLFGWVWYHNSSHHPTSVARATVQLARSRLRWARACEAAQLNDGPRRPRLSVPRIVNDRGTALEFTLNLSRVGQTVKDLEANKDYIAATLNARRTRVHRLSPGIAKFTIEWEKNLTRSAVANPSDQINDTQLPRVELDQDVHLELDTSLLVVGESGSGKSNLTWYVLNKLNKLQINYRLYVIDPKKVELADLVDSPYTVVYADSAKDADAVINRFHSDMMATFERMKRGRTRKIELNQDNPLCLLIIDELLLCGQAVKGIDTPLGEVLSAGRAAGYICIADSQLGQVDALSRLRDLFPQRVCMAIKSADITNATLGPRAEERGARCTEITEKGVGYIYTDYAGNFQRFRPPYIENIAAVAAGNVWYPPPKKRRKAS